MPHRVTAASRIGNSMGQPTATESEREAWHQQRRSGKNTGHGMPCEVSYLRPRDLKFAKGKHLRTPGERSGRKHGKQERRMPPSSPRLLAHRERQPCAYEYVCAHQSCALHPTVQLSIYRRASDPNLRSWTQPSFVSRAHSAQGHPCPPVTMK